MNTVCISTKNVCPRETIGDKKTPGVPSTSKSRGEMFPCPPTYLRQWWRQTVTFQSV